MLVGQLRRYVTLMLRHAIIIAAVTVCCRCFFSLIMLRHATLLHAATCCRRLAMPVAGGAMPLFLLLLFDAAAAVRC